LISLQRYALVLTLRLAVYTLFGKARSNLGKNFLHPQKCALPYTYGRDGELNYYHGPHELCTIAGGPQNQLNLS